MRIDDADAAPGSIERQESVEALTERHWHPIAVLDALTDEEPVLLVRLLSQSLVLFRSNDGTVGLIQERCPHGGYPLEWAWVDDNSLVCGRHAWHFDSDGKCFIVGYQSKIYPMDWAQARTYPVASYGGIYWAYVGDQPARASLDQLLQEELARVLQS